MTKKQIIDKYQKARELYERATTDGERKAAYEAMQRIFDNVKDSEIKVETEPKIKVTGKKKGNSKEKNPVVDIGVILTRKGIGFLEKEYGLVGLSEKLDPHLGNFVNEIFGLR